MSVIWHLFKSFASATKDLKLENTNNPLLYSEGRNCNKGFYDRIEFSKNKVLISSSTPKLIRERYLLNRRELTLDPFYQNDCTKPLNPFNPQSEVRPVVSRH